MTGPDRPEETGHDHVRALLADLGSGGSHPPGPVPDDVAARLDATLADLAGPGRETEVAEVTERRRWPRLLVAAAVVVVLGTGGVTTARLVTQGSADEGSSSSTSAGGGAAEEAPDESADQSLRGADDLPAVRRTTLAADATTLLDARAAARTDSALGRCAAPPGRGDRYAVRLDGEPAVLVVRPVRPAGGDGRVVEAWACDASRVLASTRVSAPPG